MAFLDDVSVMVLLGGALIGLAAGILRLLTGRVMSASGMIGSLLGGREGLAAASIAFIGGIAIAPAIMTALGFASQRPLETDWPFLVVGGLLVGLSARVGGASLGGALTGMASRPQYSAVVFLTILAGAGIAVYAQALLGVGGFA